MQRIQSRKSDKVTKYYSLLCLERENRTLKEAHGVKMGGGIPSVIIWHPLSRNARRYAHCLGNHNYDVIRAGDGLQSVGRTGYT